MHTCLLLGDERKLECEGSAHPRVNLPVRTVRGVGPAQGRTHPPRLAARDQVPPARTRLAPRGPHADGGGVRGGHLPAGPAVGPEDGQDAAARVREAPDGDPESGLVSPGPGPPPLLRQGQPDVPLEPERRLGRR